MSHMADRLNCSPSYLSAVEFGRRPVPVAWVPKIAEILELSTEEQKLVQDAALATSSRARGAVMLPLDELSPLQEEVALAFARKIKELSDEELNEIRQRLLEGRTGERNWQRNNRPDA